MPKLSNCSADQLEGGRLSNRAVRVVRGGIRATIRDHASLTAIRLGVVNPLGFYDVVGGFVRWEIVANQTFDERIIIRKRGDLLGLLKTDHAAEYSGPLEVA